MSSVGTGRAAHAAWCAYQAAVLDVTVSDAECERLRREYLTATDIHQDYLQAERDKARADAEER